MQARGRFPLGMAEARWPPSAHRTSLHASMLPIPPLVSTSLKHRDGYISQGRVMEAGIEGKQGDTPKCLGDFWAEEQNAPSHLGGLGSGQYWIAPGRLLLTYLLPPSPGPRAGDRRTRRRGRGPTRRWWPWPWRSADSEGRRADAQGAGLELRSGVSVWLCVETQQRSPVPACSHLRPHSPPRESLPSRDHRDHPCFTRCACSLPPSIVLLVGPTAIFPA